MEQTSFGRPLPRAASWRAPKTFAHTLGRSKHIVISDLIMLHQIISNADEEILPIIDRHLLRGALHHLHLLISQCQRPTDARPPSQRLCSRDSRAGMASRSWAHG